MTALTLKDASALAILADALELSPETATRLIDGLDSETAKRVGEALRTGVEPTESDVREVFITLRNWAKTNRENHASR